MGRMGSRAEGGCSMQLYGWYGKWGGRGLFSNAGVGKWDLEMKVIGILCFNCVVIFLGRKIVPVDI